MMTAHARASQQKKIYFPLFSIRNPNAATIIFIIDCFDVLEHWQRMLRSITNEGEELLRERAVEKRT
jgi:hypothetical protein